MIRSMPMVLACLLLMSCQKVSDSQVLESGNQPQATGRDAYLQVCADCHEEGVNGAPRTDHAEDWEGRSSLWQAVLFEHAEKGYLDMPAKGGSAGLDDKLVADAAEYMLERTHSELPAD